jgi:O-antigen ligase
VTQNQQVPFVSTVPVRPAAVVLSIQIASLCAFVVLLMRPFDVPDPFAIGPELSWTVICLATGTMVLLPELLVGGWPATRLDGPLAAYLAIVVVTGILGVDRGRTLVWTASLAGNVAVFASIVVVGRKAAWVSDALLVFVVSSIALLLLLATTYHAAVGLLVRPTLYPSPEGWSGYPELGMLGAVQVGLLVAALQTCRRWPVALCTAALLAVTIAEILLLYSRGAWLAVACALAAAGGLLLAHGSWKRVLAAILALAVITGTVVVTNPTVKHLLVGGGSAVVEGTALIVSPPENRLALWRRTLRMIRDHPLTGVGLGNFRAVFEAVYNPVPNSDGRRGVHAHNVWLQQFAELGIAGGAANVLLWAWVFVLAWRRALEAPGFQSIAALLALVAIAASNATTNMFYLPGSAAGRLHSLTWALFGIVATAPAPRHPRPDTRVAPR